MALTQVVLWIHALCGVVWVGALASFVLAAAALSGEGGELREFAVRAAPRINRVCLVLACAIPLTGTGNLIFAARARGFALPREFIGIVSAKIALYAVMALLLRTAWHAETALRAKVTAEAGSTAETVEIRYLMKLYGFSVGAGALALGLGLWLSGT
jgi:hypothetical protein